MCAFADAECTLCTMLLADSTSTIVIGHIKTHNGYTLLHEIDVLDVRVSSEGFPGNIWIDVLGFIVLLSHKQTLVRAFMKA